MTELPELRADVADWIFRLREGTLQPADCERLNQWLLASPENQAVYLETLTMLAALAWTRSENGRHAPGDPLTATGPMSGSAEIAEPPRRAQGAHCDSPVLGFLGTAVDLSVAWLSSPKALALTVAGGLLTYFVVLVVSIAISRSQVADRDSKIVAQSAAEPRSGTQTSAPQGGTGVGSLQPHGQAEWSRATTKSIGSAAHVGQRYELLSGRVNIVLARGTHLAIEGPAVWRFASDQRLQLDAGRVAARVPPAAIGFTVVTPTAEVVDLGTRFVVDVASADETKVAVTQGAVTLRTLSGTAEKPVQTGGASIQVAAGQAIKVSRTSAVDVVARSASFDAGWTRQAVLLDEVIDHLQDQSSSPAAISVNLAGFDSAGSLAPTAAAGFVSVAHWNNLQTVGTSDEGLTTVQLEDNSGTVTKTSITTKNFCSLNFGLGAGFFQFGGYPAGSADATMLNTAGFVRNVNDSTPLDVIVVSNIPYQMYDVYVYSNQGSDDGRTSYFTIGSQQQELAIILAHSSTPEYVPRRNYVKFARQSTPTFTLSVQGFGQANPNFQTAICGLQIVDASPPTGAPASR